MKLSDIPLGLCQCGCGEQTAIAMRNDKHHGWIKGQPKRYRQHHHLRRTESPYLIDPDTGCWLWKLKLTPDGYARTRVKQGSASVFAHRLYYERAYGPIPADHELHHECEVRHCVNPSHLRALTRADHRRLRRDTKLSPEAVREIRRRPLSVQAMADKHGVSRRMVFSVLAGDSWAL